MSDEPETPDAIESDIRETAQSNARKAGELEQKLLEKIESKLETMDPKEAAQSLQAVANMKARNIEKLKSLAERAPEQPDPEALIVSMINKGYLTPTGQAAAAFAADGEEPSQ